MIAKGQWSDYENGKKREYGEFMRRAREFVDAGEAPWEANPANRGRDIKPKLLLRRALLKSGMFGFRVNYRIGTTHVDVAFPSKWAAVEVRGCYWHRCPVCKLGLPKTDTDFWERKFALNVERDARARESLIGGGWTPLEFWEHELDEALPGCVERVRRALYP